MSTDFQVGDLLVSHNEAPYSLTTKGAIVLVVEVAKRMENGITVLLLERVIPGHYYSWQDLLENHQKERWSEEEGHFRQKRFWVNSRYFTKTTDPRVRRSFEVLLFSNPTASNPQGKALPKRLF